MPDSVNSIDSKFRFILIAAKRARQLQAGAKPLISHTTSRKPTRIAQEEVRAGAVKFELIPLTKPEAPANPEEASKKVKR